MENLEPDTRPIRPPEPPDPFNLWSKFEPILKYAYRLKKSRCYIPLLAALAFVAGYFLFLGIARLEGAFVHPNPLLGFQERDLVYMAFIEQAVLGVAVFFFFALSRTYQLTLFIYAGFLTYHIQLITERMTTGEPFLVLLTPVFIYAFTGLLVTLGLLFNKRLGLLFLVLSMLLLAQHNTQTLTGHSLSIRGIFSSPESEQSAEQPQNTPRAKQSGNIKWKWLGTYYGAETDKVPVIVMGEKVHVKYPDDPYQEARIVVLPVGEFTEGEYKGAILSLALFQFVEQEITGGTASIYFYFISGPESHMPYAWHEGGYHNDASDCAFIDCPWLLQTFKKELGLSDILPTPSVETALPPELTARDIVTDTNRHFVIRDDRLQVPDAPVSMTKEIGKSTSGWPVVEISAPTNYESVNPYLAYYLLLPFGKAIELDPAL